MVKTRSHAAEPQQGDGVTLESHDVRTPVIEASTQDASRASPISGDHNGASATESDKAHDSPLEARVATPPPPPTTQAPTSGDRRGDDSATKRISKMKALAQARLELAAARLAFLEAQMEEEASEGLSFVTLDRADVGPESPHRPSNKSRTSFTADAVTSNDATPATLHTCTPTATNVQCTMTSSCTATQDGDAARGDKPPTPAPHVAGPDNMAPAQTPTPPPQTRGDNAIVDLAAAILEVARGGSRPPANSRYPDLPFFNGNCSEWLYFKAAFTQSQAAFSEHENVARLRKSLKGIAFEAVKGAFICDMKADEIMSKLQSRFGRPHALVSCEIEKLRSLPKLIDNPREVCIFASKVNNIVSTVRALNKVEYLYNPDAINLVTDKLTTVLRNRWYDFEYNSQDSEPGLIKLSRFLDREAELNARHAKPEVCDDNRQPRPHRTMKATVNDNNNKVVCSVCNETGHSPITCLQFKSLPVLKRWEIARQMKLCFRCLNKRKWQHRCKSVKCAAHGCPYYHHRLLHNDDGPQPRRVVTATQPPSAEGSTCTRAGGGSGHTQAADGSARTQAADYSASPLYSGTSVTEVGVNAPAGAMGAPAYDTAWQPAAVTSTWAPRAASTFLKVIPVKLTGPKGILNTYGLLDDGSTVTLLTAEIACRIGAQGPAAPFYIEAVGGARVDASSSQRVKLSICGKYNNNNFNIEARTIDKLDISPQSIKAEALQGCEHLRELSHQLVYEVGEPTILIGQDNWELLLTTEVRQGAKGQPVASLTPLGWVLHGQRHGYIPSSVSRPRCNHVSRTSSLERLVQDHFELDTLGVEPRRPRSDPESRALQILQSTTRPLPDGGYETGLLWKEEGKPFPNNRTTALGRLESVEKRLKRDPQLKKKYAEQVSYLLRNGYAEPAPTPAPSGKTWYLPHFPVLNPAKPEKVRIVHDAAACAHGVCLNDYLLTGPDLLKSLLGVLMRFRQRKVAVSADIKDMFLRIKIRECDRDALRFLWRDEPDTEPTEYRMASVLFGATCSPSTAIFVKNYNACRFEDEFPQAAKAIINNHYMDDFLQSFDSPEEANRVSKAVDAVHRRGNFQLQKWASNDSAAIAGLATDDTNAAVNITKEEKVLGLVWRPADDTLSFNTSSMSKFDWEVPTKRQLLKAAMSLFDPLGLVTPVAIQAKQILQKAWRNNVGWDEPLPPQLLQTWQSWIGALKDLKGLALPRCYPKYSGTKELQLHVFVDASEVAYAAAAYWRSVDGEGNVTVSLAAAKGRVAPLKVTSIPRLELQAAVLGARLACTVEKEHERRPDLRVMWSDSRTVLSWLRAGAHTFKPFVAHRVAELEETTDVAEWRWVPSAHNPADDATRQIPTDFSASHRWFVGPSFLYLGESLWPRSEDPLTLVETGEERTTSANVISHTRLEEGLPDIKRFSSWLRLIRSTARIVQFIDRCKTQAVTSATTHNRHADSNDPEWRAIRRGHRAAPPIARAPTRAHTTAHVPLPAQYTRRAEVLWIRALQEQSFSAELRDVAGGRKISNNSRLRQLSMFIDEHGIRRLRSRTAAATDTDGQTQSPTILDGNHAYCRLYIDWVHRKYHHQGVEHIANEVRQQHWVLRLRPTVRTIIKQCQRCRIRRAVPSEPPTGDLPPCRLAHHQRPFTQTGVDYFGPLSVTVARHHEKRYVALFTCLTTRAVHLELASTLAADSAILALRRMMARRGSPETIWSDNGTNFHGADAELRRAALTSLQREADVRRINWRFIPPGAPFMGGAWERLVRSVKTALATTLHDRHPHEDVLHTLLTEVEHTVNSRPLSHVSVSAEDDAALTPNHFLLGGPSRVPLPGTFVKEDELRRSHWRASQRLADLFWQRWVREVLPLLQNRREPHGRGDAIKVGDLVVVVDETLPRNVWPKGRVERTLPGVDGVVRVVDIRTKNGVMRRPTKRLIIIPTE